MSHAADRIMPTSSSIVTYLDNLKNRQYQIPTFQREVVWEKDNVKKLWDSIYKFYPIGSILIWKTTTTLQNHRMIGGHIITDDIPLAEYNYILDGQQRTVSLLTSLYGDGIKGKEYFDPTLYIDLTVGEEEDDNDEQMYKERFLFWDDIDDRDGAVKRNIPRKKRFDEGLIVKLRDVKENYNEVEKVLYEKGYHYDHPHLANLRKIKNVLDNYRISFIELRGIEISEVCEIFERINQEGKPLDIFDIVVAKTFRPSQDGGKGFYLRELIEKFREETGGNFAIEIDDLTYLQMLTVMIMSVFKDSGIYNITETNLNKIRTEQIENIWDDAQKAFLKTFDFFDNHLHIKGPRLIPYRYFYMSISSYFFQNTDPDYDLLKRYFWYYSFHSDELLRNTTHLLNHFRWLEKARNGEKVSLEPLVLNKDDLRKTTYSSKGRFSRAILSLYSNHQPRDWKHKDRIVISDTYYLLTDKPNLHHIFPINYFDEISAHNKQNIDSLMNIAFLPQITNLEIRDKGPLHYLLEYDYDNFEQVLKTHCIPLDIITWARQGKMPQNAYDQFLEKRVDLICDIVRHKLKGLDCKIIDTSLDISF